MSCDKPRNCRSQVGKSVWLALLIPEWDPPPWESELRRWDGVPTVSCWLLWFRQCPGPGLLTEACHTLDVSSPLRRVRQPSRWVIHQEAESSERWGEWPHLSGLRLDPRPYKSKQTTSTSLQRPQAIFTFIISVLRDWAILTIHSDTISIWK